MNETTNKVECIHCGCILPDGHTTPCPKCGKTGRKISIGIAVSIEVANHLTLKKLRVYYEKKPWAIVVLVFITLGAPFFGLVFIGWAGVVAGIIFSIAALLIGLVAVKKVKESESYL